jgi:hypothetical protein
MATFSRPHHQRIAQVLAALNGDLLRENQCWFAGGTVIAMRYGEYRESVDVDFLVSDLASYRNLRERLTTVAGIAAIVGEGEKALTQMREIRADQYGIRTMLLVDNQPIKFEIVLEGRIKLESPSATDVLCNIATLTPLDMATSKLLANSDRWADDGVFNRDIIDLAMMKPSLALLRAAVTKAESAYGQAIRQDLEKALQRLQQRQAWLARCMAAMGMTLPQALLWQNLRSLKRILD